MLYDTFEWFVEFVFIFFPLPELPAGAMERRGGGAEYEVETRSIQKLKGRQETFSAKVDEFY